MESLLVRKNFHRSFRGLRQYVISFFLAVVMLSGLAVPVMAQAPEIDLQLGDDGAITWNVGNIKPGDSGAKTVSLHNDGNRDGHVRIWFTNVVNREGANPESETGDKAEPGELGGLLTLRPAAPGLETNLAFPLPLNNFPDSVTSSSFISINRITAGQTINLVWNWELPMGSGNSTQGDTVSFTIHYYMEEVIRTTTQVVEEPTSTTTEPTTTTSTTIPPTTTQTINIEVEVPGETQQETSMGVTGNGNLDQSYYVTVVENELSISFEKGTQVLTTNGLIPTKIVVKEVAETALPPPPAGFTVLSPAYVLQGFTADGKEAPVEFSAPVGININWDAENIPNVDYETVFVAYYDQNAGWVQLEVPAGFVAEVGKAAGQINNLRQFVVLGKVTAVKPPITTTEVIIPKLPARFELSYLEVIPRQVEVGNLVFVHVLVANTGELSGEYLVRVLVDGKPVQSQVVVMGPQQNRRINFTLIGDRPGNYEVTIGGMKDSYDVLGGPSYTVTNSYLWEWLVISFLVILALFFIIFGRRRRRKKDEEAQG